MGLLGDLPQEPGVYPELWAILKGVGDQRLRIAVGEALVTVGLEPKRTASPLEGSGASGSHASTAEGI
jgi:hypothetical protein